MVEMDFVTRFTAVFPDETSRGGASLALRLDKVIMEALEHEGIVFKETPENALVKHCHTDVFRIEYMEEEA